MSHVAIQTALEKRLGTLLPAIATAYENVGFTPVNGAPYQRVYYLPNKPMSDSMGRTITKLQGIFQVSLYYPEKTGRGACQARADEVAELFKPPMTLQQGDLSIHVIDPPAVGKGSPDGGYWSIPVSVYWHCYTT